ncbi:MAG: hypothetical protein GY739_10545, partial [Mesoflavibacter sp.]|nr:hypothetical protein [Mesoflavibacter sp.]
ILGTLLRSSPFKPKKHGTMHVDWTNEHASLIVNINNYCRNWPCDNCHDYSATSVALLKKHCKACNGASFQPKIVNPRVFRFQCALSVFDRLAKYGVTVQPDQRYFTQFSCWDLESCGASITENDPATSSCLKYMNRQYVIAASVKSTLPPFDIAVCLRSSEYDPRGLVSQMVDYFNEISKSAAEYEMIRLQSVFDQIDSKVEDYTRTAEDATDPEIAAYSESTAKQLGQLRNRLETMCKKHVFFGFCSARYDTKLIMEELI